MRHPNAGEINELSRQIDALALRRARLVARFDADRGYELDGSVNTVAWLKTHCGLTTHGAMEVMHVARRLPELPRVDEALEHGQISFQHAAVIAESADKLGSESLLQHQDQLVQRAEATDPSALREDVRRVEHQVDREHMLREAEWAHQSRYLHLNKQRDGRVRLEGLLDAEGGAVVKTAIDAVLGPRSNTDLRTEGQRRADGLVDVAKRCLEGRKVGETGGQRPHLNITVELETLLALRDNPGSIDGVGPMVLETIERHLCDASVSVTALLNGEVVMAGKERRSFSPALRRALSVRKRTCQFPGCDRPVSWCEGHHLWRWLFGGKTTLDNGCLVCGGHHRLLHEGRWRLERESDGWVAVSPSGERHKSVKAPPAA
jgi:hypothetical protein